MKSLELLTVAAISGIIGGAISGVFFEGRVLAQDKSAQTLEIDTLKVNHIILGDELRILASDSKQTTPDLLINKLGIANFRMMLDQTGKPTAAFLTQLSSGEGLQFSYFQDPDFGTPLIKNHVNASGLAVETGILGSVGGQDVITVGDRSVSISTKTRHVVVNDQGIHCYRGVHDPAQAPTSCGSLENPK